LRYIYFSKVNVKNKKKSFLAQKSKKKNLVLAAASRRALL
jgi:hypothetical protein